MHTENTIDKTTWDKRGEWDDEPDRVEWKTKTGLDALALRSPLTGVWTAYVTLPKGHILAQESADPSNVFDVHGGITAHENIKADTWRIGFHCSHAGDQAPLLAHPPNTPATYRSLAFVMGECEKLGEQIKPKPRVRVASRKPIPEEKWGDAPKPEPEPE